jgi:hypothetical protein
MQQLSIVADHCLLDMASTLLPPGHLYYSVTDFLSKQLHWKERDIMSASLNTRRETMITALANCIVDKQGNQQQLSDDQSASMLQSEVG